MKFKTLYREFDNIYTFLSKHMKFEVESLSTQRGVKYNNIMNEILNRYF